MAQLRCFVAVAEEQHFGRAAERLHLTPSPVSRAVKDLERELEVQLFHRRYHLVELTTAGEFLLERARGVLAELDRIRVEVRLAAAPGTRTVRLGGTHWSPPAVLDAVTECAEKACPDHTVEVTHDQSSRLLEALARSELDAAVVHLPVDPAVAGTLPLAAYRFRVVLRRDDPLADREQVSIDDLAGRVFLLMESTLQPLAMSRFGQQLRTRGVHRMRVVPDADIVRVASEVRRTGDVTLTLSPATGGAARVFDDPAFAVVPLADPLDFHLGLAWRADKADDLVVAALLDAVRERWADGELVL
jgi:DNA-binding transcriptional LysR family regulator